MNNAIDFNALRGGLNALLSAAELEYASLKRQLQGANALIKQQRDEIAASDNLVKSLTDEVLALTRQLSKFVGAKQPSIDIDLTAARSDGGPLPDELVKELMDQFAKLAAFAASLDITE